MLWILSLASIAGTILNVQKKRTGFLVWISTNAAWLIVSLIRGPIEQAPLWAVYCALAVWGFVKWGKP